jgi:hypothetical protein
MDASSEAATITLTLIARAAEPTDADAYLAEAARVLESRLKSPITALRALDADLDSFVAPSRKEASSLFKVEGSGSSKGSYKSPLGN